MQPEALNQLKSALGTDNVLTTPEDKAGYLTDWTGRFTGSASAVVRPANTEQVADVVKLANRHTFSITPQGGNTSSEGGSVPVPDSDGVVLSLDRMRSIRELNTSARTATIEAGVVLDDLRSRAHEQALTYPVVFGSRGSCTLGGTLATNAGGSNVLRYGNTRDLCLGIEAVLANGTVVNNLTGLRKDNTGYDLRHLLIGSEGTLGIITTAVVRLVAQPRAYATAFVAVPDVARALDLLNTIQDRSGGLVEAFEYLPACMSSLIVERVAGTRMPLAPVPEHAVLIELGSTRDVDCQETDDGTTPLVSMLESLLEDSMQQGCVLDATIARSEQQRADLWHLRESAFEAVTSLKVFKGLDIAVPLDRVERFLGEASRLETSLGLRTMKLAHLGDGNLHFVITHTEGAAPNTDAINQFADQAYDIVQQLDGSIAAEHGIGQSKRVLLAARKDSGALAAMQNIKQAFDPNGIMNPGKLL